MFDALLIGRDNVNDTNNTLSPRSPNNTAEQIRGLGGNDRLSSRGGNDSLEGGSGNDTLEGGNGDDTLNGGNHRDTLRGGAGNDHYEDRPGDEIDDPDEGGGRLAISQPAQQVDVIEEAVGGGVDTVNVIGVKDYKLALNVENVILSGVSSRGRLALNVIGNSSNNLLKGNQVNNIMSGEVGKDTLEGGQGNDALRGGLGDDTLKGDAGNDTLIGANQTTAASPSPEKDILFGGIDQDTFVLGTSTQFFYNSFGSSDYALIKDFSTLDKDRIQLRRSRGYRLETTVFPNAGSAKADTLIFRGNDLTAVVQDASGLNLGDRAAFVFV